MIDLEGEIASVDAYRVSWLLERKRLDDTIAECNATKTTPPNNHWEAERKARLKYTMAAAVLGIIALPGCNATWGRFGAPPEPSVRLCLAQREITLRRGEVLRVVELQPCVPAVGNFE